MRITSTEVQVNNHDPNLCGPSALAWLEEATRGILTRAWVTERNHSVARLPNMFVLLFIKSLISAI